MMSCHDRLIGVATTSGWPVYAYNLIRRQAYSEGSIDHALLAGQILVTRENRGRVYAPPGVQLPAPGEVRGLACLVGKVSERQREPIQRLMALTRWCHRIPHDHPSQASSTAGGIYADFAGFRWGGDEEAVIAKGSPWPQEIARVLVTLVQIAGFPARLVFLYREEPLELHTVVEAWVHGHWIVFDPCANRFYLRPHHGYACALDLQQQPKLVDQMPEHGRIQYVDSAFYRTFAIAEYALNDRDRFRYVQQPARVEDLPALQRAAQVFIRAAVHS
ncbi:MAG: transglutaminase domain-containing protein [Dehalococcoidia bacterium]